MPHFRNRFYRFGNILNQKNMMKKKKNSCHQVAKQVIIIMIIQRLFSNMWNALTNYFRCCLDTGFRAVLCVIKKDCTEWKGNENISLSFFPYHGDQFWMEIWNLGNIPPTAKHSRVESGGKEREKRKEPRRTK